MDKDKGGTLGIDEIKQLMDMLGLKVRLEGLHEKASLSLSHVLASVSSVSASESFIKTPFSSILYHWWPVVTTSKQEALLP